jgi:zinc transport system permease protein
MTTNTIYTAVSLTLSLNMDDFIVRALLAGSAVVMLAGLLGSILVWRRLAYLGDTLSHSSLLGVALGLLTGFSINIWMMMVCAIVALLLLYVQYNPRLSSDTLLTIIGQSALAIGTVALTFLPGVRVDLMAYLFGDILAVSHSDVLSAWGLTFAIFAIMYKLWRPLIALAVHEPLAQVEGVNVKAVSAAYMLLVAFTVAIAMKVVGVLLLTALLIIPAATARRFARTPEMMVGLAIVFGLIALAGGMFLSLQFDTPTGPSIVMLASLLFLVTQFVPSRATA